MNWTFKTAHYQGFWMSIKGDRTDVRSQIEASLRNHLHDPTGKMEVREDGPRWVTNIAGAAPHISYSHSGDQALVVYSGTGPIGVDIEHSHRKLERPFLETAKRFFHPDELPLITSQEKFLELWCKKEALGKMTRTGLKISIHEKVEPASDTQHFDCVPVRPSGWIAWVCFKKT